jgi:hypothetical protein
MYYEGTMEHTAVQLMSRKQRAAKLLTGDIGLTGLDAITEGEGGFEAALMDAIARDETLLDPSEMFKASAGQSDIDADDAAFWNVEVDEEDTTEIVSAEPVVEPDKTESVTENETAVVAVTDNNEQDTRKVQRFVRRYLETVCILPDVSRQSALQAEVIHTMLHGVMNDDDTRQVVGMLDADFARYPVHEKQLVKWTRKWLKQKRFVFTGCEDEVAQKAVTIAKQALGMEPLQLDVFEALQDMQDEQLQTQILDDLKEAEARPLPEAKPVSKGGKKTIDLLAVPEDSDDSTARKRPFVRPPEHDEPRDPPKQLAMF